LGPVGCRVLIHAKPATRRSWDFRAKNGFYIGPAMDSYRCFKLVNADTKSTCPSRLRLQKTESFMAFRLLPVPSRVRRRPQAFPRSKPLPTFETSSNHGDYSRLPPSSRLESRFLAVQGCLHMTLQGGYWYRPHRQHWPTR
jgi:hypothetical protein